VEKHNNLDFGWVWPTGTSIDVGFTDVYAFLRDAEPDPLAIPGEVADLISDTRSIDISQADDFWRRNWREKFAPIVFSSIDPNQTRFDLDEPFFRLFLICLRSDMKTVRESWERGDKRPSRADAVTHALCAAAEKAPTWGRCDHRSNPLFRLTLRSDGARHWKPADPAEAGIDIYVRPAGEPGSSDVTAIEFRGLPLDVMVDAFRGGAAEEQETADWIVDELSKYLRQIIRRTSQGRRGRKPRGCKPEDTYALLDCAWLNKYCEWTIEEIADRFCEEKHTHLYGGPNNLTDPMLILGAKCWDRFEKKTRDYWMNSSRKVFPLLPVSPK
jgi:hypothetical protein